VEIALDTEPRTVRVPGDLAAALAADPIARATFERTPETRSKRLAKSMGTLRSRLPR
jgi:uncharacterized protein YdeI (YjbR/CyaY-like superfamily)